MKRASETNVILMILGLCLLQYTMVLRLVTPGKTAFSVPERVDYGSKCFAPDAHVLLSQIQLLHKSR
jgi:hypothetical protein